MVIIIIILYIAYAQTSAGLESFEASNSGIVGINESTETFSETTAKYPSFFDFLFIFLVFGIWLTIFITSFILGNNPIFLVIYGVISFGLVIVAIVLEIALGEITSNVQLAPYFVSFPMMMFFIDYFLVFALFFIFSIAIALYFKSGATQ